MDLRVSAVIADAELLGLKSGLVELGAGSSVVNTFQTDLEALQTMYIDGRPDLLVLDLDLPGVIGVETVKAMRQQTDLAALPMIVICSGATGATALAATHAVCLTRPVLTEDWKDAVTRSLSERPATPPAAEESKSDSRRAARRTFEAPCVVSTTTRKTKGVIKNISLTGAGVVVEKNMAAASMITLIFAVPNVVPIKIVQFKARIVRQTEDGYGIHFWEMDPATRGFLASFTQKQEEPRVPEEPRAGPLA